MPITDKPINGPGGGADQNFEPLHQYSVVWWMENYCETPSTCFTGSGVSSLMDVFLQSWCRLNWEIIFPAHLNMVVDDQRKSQTRLQALFLACAVSGSSITAWTVWSEPSQTQQESQSSTVLWFEERAACGGAAALATALSTAAFAKPLHCKILPFLTGLPLRSV